MQYKSILQRAGKWLVVASFLSFGFAMAQAEPTMDQVYAAAQAGKLEQAQTMMLQVLVAHPNSAKAHYVQSELYARQGKLAQAREALATAEKLAPGLPFAKAGALQALRSQLSARSTPSMTLGGAQRRSCQRRVFFRMGSTFVARRRRDCFGLLHVP